MSGQISMFLVQDGDMVAVDELWDFVSLTIDCTVLSTRSDFHRHPGASGRVVAVGYL